MKNANGRVQPQEILTGMREIQITWALKALGRYHFASSRDPLSPAGLPCSTLVQGFVPSRIVSPLLYLVGIPRRSGGEGM